MTIFIVRILAVTPETCQGRVRHVRTGREETFRDWEQLHDFLSRMTSDMALPAGADGAAPPGNGSTVP